MTLQEFRETLLRLEHPEEVLLLADKYMNQMEALGDNFILPKAHVLVKPALEYYAGDLEGWMKFVKGVRDRLPRKGRAYHEGVNKLYRMLEVRWVQQWRRERISRAVDIAVRKGLIPDTPADKITYGKRCEQVWKKAKKMMELSAAKQTKRGVLSTAERELLLEEFWRNLDAAIDNGEVPKP